MRIGQNPAKSVDHVAQPNPVTVAIVTYIPFLSGYYAHSLDVFKACLESLWQNTDMPYDLLVFDNASCPEVRSYLTTCQAEGKIQFLLLSDRNIGKGGAWNIIFAGAPGEYIAYADSDIYFFPGWLSALRGVMDRFPQAGMVTGVPLWSPEEFSTATVQWAESHPEAQLERGQFLSWEDYWRHSRSLGSDEAKARAHFAGRQDIRLTYAGQQHYIGAGHFQFLARKSVLQEVLPIPSDRPMGQVRSLDIALNQRGYLRLSTPDWWVQHLGNTLEGVPTTGSVSVNPPAASQSPPKGRSGLWRSKLARKLLTWLYDKSFNLLYRS